ERIVTGKSPTATIYLKAYQMGSRIGIDVVDDGRGLDLESIQQTALNRGLYTQAELARMSAEQIQNLIFAPGFSTRTTVTEMSGRGVGLDVVRVNVEQLRGAIQVHSTPAQGCTFRFSLNTRLATTAALILAVNQTPYAIPIEFVDVMMRVDPQDVFVFEGSPTIHYQDHPLSVAWLTDLLDLPVSVIAQPRALSVEAKPVSCVVLKVGSERLGLFVDDLLDQQDIVLKPHSKLLKRVRNIVGATILGTGEVCMVLNPQDLIKSAQVGGTDAGSENLSMTTAPKAPPKVLLVEDSLPIRTLMQRILIGAGYRVTTAVDGLDGLDKLQGEVFDAVVSDVEMPNLDGLGLTNQIRQYSKYKTLPIVLVTTLAKEEDQRRGAEAGANAYITKGDFDQSLLINTLRRLI
ncbi:MAG: response regulator, partial [Cyanobacteria bacterium P01_F01_bin.4]